MRNPRLAGFFHDILRLMFNNVNLIHNFRY